MYTMSFQRPIKLILSHGQNNPLHKQIIRFMLLDQILQQTVKYLTLHNTNL